MNVAEIKDILLNMYLGKDYNNSSKKCSDNVILIDGPWGCGKTYKVNEFIELVTCKHSHKEKGHIQNNELSTSSSQKSDIEPSKELRREIKKSSIKKVIYVSLYGAMNIRDVEEYITRATKNKKLTCFKKVVAGTAGIIAAVTPFSSLNKASESIQYVQRIDSDNRPKIKKGTMIIFDDLERVNYKEFSYVDLMGYINSLVSLGVKVVCLCCESIIAKHLQEEDKANNGYPSYDDYEDFKEKTFDHIYNIDNMMIEAVYDIANGYSIDESFAEDALDITSNNLRIIRNSILLANNIKTSLSNDDIEKLKSCLSDAEYLNCALHAVRFIYGLYGKRGYNRYGKEREYRDDMDVDSSILQGKLSFDTQTSEKLYNFIADSSHRGYLTNEKQRDFIYAAIFFYTYNDVSLILKFISENFK